MLWPCLWALWLAAGGFPSVKNLVIFCLGALVMRSAGLSLMLLLPVAPAAAQQGDRAGEAQPPLPDTLVVPPGWTAEVDGAGSIHVRRSEGGAAGR